MSAESASTTPVDGLNHFVRAPIVCVLTRFGFRSPADLGFTYRDYRKVAAEAAHAKGLLRSCFLVEDARTAYSVSIWRDASAIAWFGSDVPAHVPAGNRVLSRLRYRRGRGPELFSTRWQLVGVSHNLNWDDLDLRGEIRASGA